MKLLTKARYLNDHIVFRMPFAHTNLSIFCLGLRETFCLQALHKLRFSSKHGIIEYRFEAVGESTGVNPRVEHGIITILHFVLGATNDCY